MLGFCCRSGTNSVWKAKILLHAVALQERGDQWILPHSESSHPESWGWWKRFARSVQQSSMDVVFFFFLFRLTLSYVSDTLQCIAEMLRITKQAMGLDLLVVEKKLERCKFLCVKIIIHAFHIHRSRVPKSGPWQPQSTRVFCPTREAAFILVPV